MPYFKCVACRIRLDRAGPEVDLFEGLCPICGIVLEPATVLTEVVGFRRFELVQGEPAFETHAQARRHSLDRAKSISARRDALLERARLDAERWIDEPATFGGEAVTQWSPRNG